MSLLDLILQQKIIPLTIGIAFLLILAAVTLMIVPRIRRRRVQVAQQRAKEAALAAEAEALEEAAEPVVQARPARRAAGAATAAAAKPAAASPAAPVPPAAPPAAAKPAAALLAATPQQPAAQPEQTETSSSAMQDILSSVFSDEGNSERQAALMRDMTDVDMADLLTLTQQVVVQLHGGKTVSVVSEKELE